MKLTLALAAMAAVVVIAQPTVKDQVASQTNKIRAAHGLPPVTYNDVAAIEMQKWADSCPGFKHGGPSGWQNLASNTPCGGTNQPNCMALEGAAWLWYDQEETLWDYAANKCTKDWATCGHFSNMMSPSVTSIACGWSACANGNYVWCNYNTPVGNPVVPRNVVLPKSDLKTSLTKVVVVQPTTLAPALLPTKIPAPITTQSPTTPVVTIAPTATPWPTKIPRPSTTNAIPDVYYGMKEQLVDQTNKIRAAHDLTPVTWDAQAAVGMQTWADSCPGFKHGGPSGWQNLASNIPCGGASQPDCGSLVGAAWLWYDQEETLWDYAANKCTKDWTTCGHFSNMMSPSVKSIACGWSTCANGNYVWCNYDTPVENPVVSRIAGISKTDLKTKLLQVVATSSPTLAMTPVPTTVAPTTAPTAAPTTAPTSTPTSVPIAVPTVSPTGAPSAAPTTASTAAPTVVPSAAPTVAPAAAPTVAPTITPVAVQVPLYGQCGGAHWTGSTVCVEGAVCVLFDTFYSECQPSNA
ncbi:Aste57867_3734 [Aphanomyces stellatus]|uniref:Aste57867_3734 protein n=1 Tax=Aphanomyces stellatus TaxID=120398 RepID=A0A485KB60_9STRA|nr:hypothetical protein As57867_003723 [Aphanomyces stellatus]VFT80887.1 Aste57867_3734 [Aphanomyces stellatus]